MVFIIETLTTFDSFRTNSPEDVDEQYIRVVSTTLLGYGSLFNSITNLEDSDKKVKILTKAQMDHANILQNSKFWKLAHHQNSTVRISLS